MIRKALKDIFRVENRNHPNVGRVFYSSYFGGEIVVTSYVDDTHWRFQFVKSNEHGQKEFVAETRMSYFIEKKLERKR